MIGTTLGPYRVLEKLGEGGMGEVYLAEDQRLERRVAIKILRAGGPQDETARRRLLREARTAATLDHPNICTIYEVGEADGQTFIAMQYLQGETLAARLSKRPLTPVEALAIGGEVAGALDEAHRHGLTHRDIKPQNVMLTAKSHVTVLDFGLAKRTEEAASSDPTVLALTQPGTVAGTAPYMSPEQVRGEPIDWRSDIFSLGSLLHEMLTGRPPFACASAVDTMSAILTRDPPPIALGSAPVPELQRIVAKCLEKDRERRYQTTSDLAIDLENLRKQLERPTDAAPASTAAGAAAGRLPTARTPLLGRDAEREAACRLLLQPGVRLVTFTGAGGTGKTRLALQVAADLAPSFGGRVYFVGLAAVRDPALVMPALAQALDVREMGGRRAIDAVAESIAAAHAPVLVVLDNFEQLVSAAAGVSELLERCANLSLLVTSRAVLRIYGEHDFDVPPLALPPRTARPSVEGIAASPAVALFVDRAAAVSPGFALTPDNAGVIAAICARLDGLPLAIELAAARVRMLTPGAILQRLGRCFELLTGGARDLPARQRTLRATVEWSYGLLAPEEQTLFRRLAVFVGGGTLEAIEAVCNATEDLQGDVLDAVDALVGQSLVQRTETAGEETRFGMLELVREYVLEQLARSGDEALARRAHAAYCLVLAEESNVLLASEPRQRWLARCRLEVDNFRAALEWSVRERRVEWGLRLASALSLFWVGRELHTEGGDWLGTLLTLADDTVPAATRVAAMFVAGDLAQNQSHFDRARALYEEGLAQSRAVGESSVHAIRGLNALAVLDLRTGRFASARDALEECLTLARQVRNAPVAARALMNLGQVLHAEGDVAGAQARYEEAMATFAAVGDRSALAWSQMLLGDLAADHGAGRDAAARYEQALQGFEAGGEPPGVARALLDLGVLATRGGDHARARSLLARALSLYAELGLQSGVARALDAFGRSAILRGRPDRGLRLAGAADAIRRSLGVPLFAQEERARRVQLDAAHRAVGAAAPGLEREGAAMALGEAAAYALRDDTLPEGDDEGTERVL